MEQAAEPQVRRSAHNPIDNASGERNRSASSRASGTPAAANRVAALLIDSMRVMVKIADCGFQIEDLITSIPSEIRNPPVPVF